MVKMCALDRVALRALLAIFIAKGCFAVACWGQNSNGAAGASAQAQTELIEINLPEKLNLQSFIAYISKRLDLNILYDDKTVGEKTITIKAPNKVPAESVMDLLESMLKIQGLALVDADQPGWKRVVKVGKLVDIAHGPKESEELITSGQAGVTTVVIRVFHLKHINPGKAQELIKPYLSTSAHFFQMPEHGILMVTDYAVAFERVEELIDLVDRPSEQVSLKMVPIKHQKATDLAEQVLSVLNAKREAQAQQAGKDIKGKGKPVQLIPYERTNQVIIAGASAQVSEAIDLIRSLDVSLGQETKIYKLKIASPDRIDMLARELIGPVDVDRVYRSAIDSDLNYLVVTATPDAHKTVESLRRELDVPDVERRSPIRFYKLENASAFDVLQTLSALENNGEGSNQKPPGSRRPSSRETRPSATSGAAGSSDSSPGGSGLRSGSSRRESAPTGIMSVRGEDVLMTADFNTNSVIIVAKPERHQIYAKLIKQLDQRRPQVLIEATVVVIDTSDNFSLGVELAYEGGVEGKDVLLFSSTGLQNVGDDGGISLVPGLGFNGAVIDTNIANVVIRALSQNSRAKVVSSPRILVNDNATGILESISEEPFTSVNASDTVSTTSFGGFVEAGTAISVTPHISEGDHLTLEYVVTLNSFSGAGSEGIPPPRQTNKIESDVTVPDGHTVIVGGLNRTDFTNSVDAIPLLGEIPILKHLFSSQTDTQSEQTLFVFIRPVILRDDKFADLKLLSGNDLELAELPGNYPQSEPLTVE